MRVTCNMYIYDYVYCMYAIYVCILYMLLLHSACCAYVIDGLISVSHALAKVCLLCPWLPL